MFRDTIPSYKEWQNLKNNLENDSGHDLIDFASSLIDDLFEKLNKSEAQKKASEDSFGMKKTLKI